MSILEKIEQIKKKLEKMNKNIILLLENNVTHRAKKESKDFEKIFTSIENLKQELEKKEDKEPLIMCDKLKETLENLEKIKKERELQRNVIFRKSPGKTKPSFEIRIFTSNMEEILKEYKEEIKNAIEIKEISELMKKLEIIIEKFKENKNLTIINEELEKFVLSQ